GRVDEPGAGRGGIFPDHPALQRGAVAQRFGLPSAGGLLSWRSAEPARRPEVETGARPISPPRTKSETGTRNFTLRYGRNHRYNVRSICAIVDETNHKWTKPVQLVAFSYCTHSLTHFFQQLKGIPRYLGSSEKNPRIW